MTKSIKNSKTVKKIVEQERQNWENWKKLNINLPQRA